MPILEDDYQVKIPFFKNKHFSTIYPTQFRKKTIPHLLQRHRLTTFDHDFIDCDMIPHRHEKAAILFHGFEGSSMSRYMLGMAQHLIRNQWDVVLVNLRGCSGVPNRLARAYHAGDYEDVAFVVDTLNRERTYEHLALIGFSLGGNIVLNYMTRYRILPINLSAAIAISTPVDLRNTVSQIMKRGNQIYSHNFHRKLMRKIKQKQEKYPDLLPYDQILSSKNIDEFDANYTVPFHGFKDTADYRTQSSSLFHLHKLDRPTLLLNAKNDPFLTRTCFPYDIATQNEYFYLLTPKYGGHCGFWKPGNLFYHEEKTLNFLEKQVG